ncbi:MAG: alpha/beta fold hydrolase [Pseudomonadota bacterium]
MKILTLSGWGQPHDALADIAPNATHFDYADYETIDAALTGIAEEAKKHDAIIGWSLGGQLAVRAIATGLMQPKKLILIGVPFQFVRNDNLKMGMPRDQFDKFRDNYAKNAPKTLKKAWELIIIGDKSSEYIKNRLENYNNTVVMEKNWLHWLDMLDGFSCNELDFANFPASLLLHGEQDAVVNHAQSVEFIKTIPQAKCISFPNAGHAPHWHDSELVKLHIKEYLHV